MLHYVSHILILALLLWLAAGCDSLKVEEDLCTVLPPMGSISYFPVLSGSTWTYDFKETNYDYLIDRVNRITTDSGSVTWTVTNLTCSEAKSEVTIEETRDVVRLVRSRNAEGSFDLSEERHIMSISSHIAFLWEDGRLILHALPAERIYEAEPQWYYAVTSAESLKIEFRVPPMFRRSGGGSITLKRGTGMVELVDRREGVNPWEKYERELRLTSFKVP